MASNWYHGRGPERWLDGKFRKSGAKIASMTNGWGISTRVRAYSNVRENFEKRMMKLYGRTREGLEIAVNYLEHNTKTKPPVTPKKTGNLRDAWYKEVVDTPSGPTIEFGYEMDQKPPEGAPYAMYVHEMTEPPYDHVNWTEPKSGPEWFRIHLQNDREAMLYLIKIYAKSAIV